MISFGTLVATIIMAAK
ncbi:hypothetical protein [Veillonella atypica]